MENDIKPSENFKKEPSKYIWTVLGVSLVLFFIFLPFWPYALAWGYYPAAAFGAITLVALFFLVIGYFSRSNEPRY